jgi:hypothetical protein
MFNICLYLGGFQLSTFAVPPRCLNFFVNSKVSLHDVAGCSLTEIPLSAGSRPKMTGSSLESIHHSTD